MGSILMLFEEDVISLVVFVLDAVEPTILGVDDVDEFVEPW